MGSKNKLKRFRENGTFSNVIQPEREIVNKDAFSLKGKWNSTFFKNNNPIVLELGCGKGEYTVHLAQKHLNNNYIGIDIKGARFWRGAKTALEKNLTNVAFLRTQIEMIRHCFAENEVGEIWITFPDPQIKYKRTKHRLTHPNLLMDYKKILKPQGILHLKTDSEFYLATHLVWFLKLEKFIMHITTFTIIAMLQKTLKRFKLFMNNNFWNKARPLLTCNSDCNEERRFFFP